MDTLHFAIRDLRAENKQLRDENCILKMRVVGLEMDAKSLRAEVESLKGSRMDRVRFCGGSG